MTGRDAVPLNWKQPPEWDAFLDSVAAENYGYTGTYAGIAIERAWREYREDHPAEDLADDLLADLGLPRGAGEEKKSPDTRERAPADTGRTTVRVLPGVKDEMAAFADENDVQKHEVLRAVVCWYLNGGTLALVTEKLERAVPEAAQQLRDAQDQGEKGEDGGLSAKERRTVALCQRLPEQFTEDDLGEALEAVQGVSDSDYCREQYLPRILDRLDYREHPKVDELYLPAAQAEQYADDVGVDLDAPAIDRKPYAALTDDERVHGLRVRLTRRAAQRGGGAAVKTQQAQRGVFDGTPGEATVRKLLDRAAEASGFDTDAKDGKRLLCTLADVTDKDVLADADADDTAPGVEPADPTEQDDIDAELDRLTEEAATDGGGGR